MKSLLSIALVLFATTAFSQQYVPNANPKKADSSLKATTTHKNTVISFGFLSPINHHISFGYDQLIHGDKVLSTQLGIIGFGINQQQYTNYNPVGAFVEVGIKLFAHPDYYYDGMHRFNTMQGFYFKPQVVVSVFGQQYYYYYPNMVGGSGQHTTTVTCYGALLNLGKQWVIDNFTIDIYAGVGYYGASFTGLPSSFNEEASNAYSFIGTSSFAFTGGVNLGIAF